MASYNTINVPEVKSSLKTVNCNTIQEANSNSTLKLTWTLGSDATEVVARYCSHCGKVVDFSDSGYRRQNANGKNIFHFAIFKCEKGHTWNNKIEQFTAKSNLTNVPLKLRELEASMQVQTAEILEETMAVENTPILLTDVKAQGYDRLQIHVDIFKGKHRLDKILSERLENLSRTQLVKQIDAGFISLDGQPAKGKSTLHSQHVIEIDLEAIIL